MSRFTGFQCIAFSPATAEAHNFTPSLAYQVYGYPKELRFATLTTFCHTLRRLARSPMFLARACGQADQPARQNAISASLPEGVTRPAAAPIGSGAAYLPGNRSVRTPRRSELYWAPRSEERRVGKECRSRWSPSH